jgi:hypothetical protein
MATDNRGESVTGATDEAVAPDVDGVAGGEVTEEEAIATSSEDEGTESLSLDVIFEILRNRRRQFVLEYLREQEGTVTIGELAEHIAAIENDTTVRQLNAQQRKRVYIGLYQCHLPKMDDVDVIEFNQSRGRITPADHIEPLYEYLDVANGDHETEDEEPPFERKHGFGFLAFAAAFFAAQLSGAYVIASGIVVLFLLGTLVVVSEF